MSVSTPSLPPLLCMKSGKTYSLYTYKNGWNAKLGRSYRIPGSTKAVGKIKEGASLGEIVWKDDFIEQHPDLNDFIAFRNRRGHWRVVTVPVLLYHQMLLKNAKSLNLYCR